MYCRMSYLLTSILQVVQRAYPQYTLRVRGESRGGGERGVKMVDHFARVEMGRMDGT